MKKITFAKTLLGASLFLTACETVPADAIENNVAGRDRLGYAANALLGKMDLTHPANSVEVKMNDTLVESPFNNDKTPWSQHEGTIKSPYGDCAVKIVGRNNPDGTFAGWGSNGSIRIPYISKLAVATSRGSVDFEVGDPGAYDGGDPSLTVDGNVYSPTPDKGESQLTYDTLNSALKLADSVLSLCGAIPGYVPKS